MKNKQLKRVLWALLLIFIGINVVAVFHSYKFTHFSNPQTEKTKDPSNLSGIQKLKTIIFGVSIPRPENKVVPKSDYQIITIQGNKEIECWSIQAKQPKGTVILFHGYGGNKSSMLDKAEIFIKLGYSTLLVDFMGSGGSEGNQTTIGFLEAQQVKSSFEYVTGSGDENIILFGTSMGAAAILKCINDYQIKPAGIILECPYGTIYQTVCARFDIMNVPSFPGAALLTFWGGLQNGFWAFGHNPIEYAKNVKCPALLLYGAKDEKVSRRETDEIFENLSGKKTLSIYPEAGHENYLTFYKSEWIRDVDIFLSKN